jgi:hypothetical protein
MTSKALRGSGTGGSKIKLKSKGLEMTMWIEGGQLGKQLTRMEIRVIMRDLVLLLNPTAKTVAHTLNLLQELNKAVSTDTCRVQSADCRLQSADESSVLACVCVLVLVLVRVIKICSSLGAWGPRASCPPPMCFIVIIRIIGVYVFL